MAEASERDRDAARAIFKCDKSYGFVWNARLCREIAVALAVAREEERRTAIEEAARIADEYASVNIEVASDTLLADPVLSGRGREPSDIAKSESLMIDGCIHSSMFHAAQNIAGAIRALAPAAAPSRDDKEPEGS